MRRMPSIASILIVCLGLGWSADVLARQGQGPDSCLDCEPGHLAPRLQHTQTVCFDLGYDANNNRVDFTGDQKTWLLYGLNYWSKIDQSEGGDLNFVEYPHDPNVPCPTNGEFNIHAYPASLPAGDIGSGNPGDNSIKIDPWLVNNQGGNSNLWEYEGGHEGGHLLNMNDVSHLDHPECLDQTLMFDDAANVSFPNYLDNDQNIWCSDKLVVSDMYNNQGTSGGSQYDPSQTDEDCYDVWDVRYHWSVWNGWLTVTGIERLTFIETDCGPPED